MRRRTFWITLFLVLSILTAIAIFFFSAQPAEDSAALSDGITLSVARVLRPDYEALPEAPRQSLLELLSTIVRKCAHFGEFALLGLNLMALIGLRRWGKPLPHSALMAWGIATLYAGTDELHQMFVEARGPGILDVGIDCAGALTGVLLALLLMTLLAHRIDQLK